MKPQLELSFNSTTARRAESRRRPQRRTARWWFDQMRRVVDRALDRGSIQGQPEQICFPLPALRQASGGRS